MKCTVAFLDPSGVAGPVARSLAATTDLDVVLCRPSRGRDDSSHTNSALFVPREGVDLVVTPELDEVSGADVVVLAGEAPIEAGALEVWSEDLATVIRDSDEPIVIVSDDTSNHTCDAMVTDGHLDPQRVIGTGTFSDSLRLERLVADEIGVPAEQVQALVIGAPGPAAVPLVRLATVAGVSALDLLETDAVKSVVDRFRSGDDVIDRIVSADVQARAVERIVSAVACGAGAVAVAAVCLNGEYGIEGQFVSVPAVLGRGGVEQIIELDLSLDELVLLYSATCAAAEVH